MLDFPDDEVLVMANRKNGPADCGLRMLHSSKTDSLFLKGSLPMAIEWLIRVMLRAGNENEKCFGT
jgi:hypothetical protein